ncbi:DUF4091 domain-containing protein [Draconibacterium sp.]|nr:DUF4091 domain-containing protein [Draconibacterium sp.]
MKNILVGVMAIFVISCHQSSNYQYVGVTFDEPEAPQKVSPIQDWESLENGIQAAWGTSNIRYHKEYIPETGRVNNFTCTGWKNERVYAQLVAWSKDSVKDLSIKISDLKSESGTIETESIKTFFVRNVISDEFLGGCGYKTKTPETAHLVADCLESAEVYTMRDKSTRGIWFNIDIPKNANAGIYKGDVHIQTAGKIVKTLSLTVNVQENTLPDPSDWNYHLDLWQNPFAVARVHNVELWSDEHFEKMTPLYEMLANAGQKCLTASILHKPWGGQTLDHFESMVKRTQKTDGSWEFDYAVFDKWISYMMDLGINEQINCYTLIPWGNQLHYFDELSGQDTFITAPAASKEYAEYWIPFLKNFKSHLEEKGWFDITTIAMDERPMKDMLSALKLIKQYTGLKVTSAANYNPGMSGQVYDLSVESRHVLPYEVLKERKEKDQITTFYVCCSVPYPNNFTYSPPSEGVWQGWYAYAKNLDGFLRWAYNSWVEDPMHDTRFRTWPAGDTFFVYPDAKSSIRFEKLREGIQDYEKLSILIEQLRASDQPEAKKQLQQLEEVLNEFEISSLENEGALNLVLKAKDLINKISV